MALAAVLSIVVVLGVYFFGGSSRDKAGRPIDKNTYRFLEGRTHGDAAPDAVTNANIAVNFQLLSVYPNMVFGMLGNFAVPVINAVAYAVGSVLVTWKGPTFRSSIEQGDTTLHGFIARVHNFPNLKRYTTLVSLGVFAAVVSFEVVFLARLLSSLMGGSQVAYYTLVFGFVFFVSSAIYFGGQRVAFLAENYHLLLSYVGVHLCLGILVLRSGGASSGDILLLLIGLVTLVMIGLRLRQLKTLVGPESRRRLGALLTLLICVSAFVLLVCIVRTLAPAAHPFVADFSRKVRGSFPSSILVATLMVGTAFLPAIFANQVDFSFWQRLRAMPPSGADNQEGMRSLKTSLSMYSVESPLTWVLPISLGSVALVVYPDLANMLNAAGTDPGSYLVSRLLASSALVSVFGFIFVIGLLSIAISTVDSYLSALSYLYAKDMGKSTSTEAQNAATGRAFQFFVALFIVVVFVVLDVFVKKADLLISLFLSMFAPMAALSPLVVWPLSTGRTYAAPKRSTSWLLLLASAGAGVLGLVLGVLSAVKQAASDTALYWLPIPASFVFAWALYFAYIALTPRAVVAPAAVQS